MVSENMAVLPPIRESLIGSLPSQVGESVGSPLKASGPEKTVGANFLPFGEDGFTFLDILDTVNPLQHLPIIGSIYRKITGDTLDPLPRVVGSTLYLGPVGGAISGANLILERTSGRNFDEHVLALFDSKDNRAIEDVVSQDADDPKAHKKSTAASDYLSDNAYVSSWAQSEILYRQRLLYASNIVAKKTSPSVKGGRNLNQKVNDKTPPTKNLSMLPAYTNEQIFVENKSHLAFANKDPRKNPGHLSASIAAAAYKTAMTRVDAILPLNEN